MIYIPLLQFDVFSFLQVEGNGCRHLQISRWKTDVVCNPDQEHQIKMCNMHPIKYVVHQPFSCFKTEKERHRG